MVRKRSNRPSGKNLTTTDASKLLQLLRNELALEAVLAENPMPSQPAANIPCTGATIKHPHTNVTISDADILGALKSPNAERLNLKEKNDLTKYRIMLSTGKPISQSSLYFIFNRMDKLTKERTPIKEEILVKTKAFLSLLSHPESKIDQYRLFGNKIINRLYLQMENFFNRKDTAQMEPEKDAKTKASEAITLAIKSLMADTKIKINSQNPGRKNLYTKTLVFFIHEEQYSNLDNLENFPKLLKRALNSLSQHGPIDYAQVIPCGIDLLLRKDVAIKEIPAGAVGTGANTKSRGLGKKHDYIPKPTTYSEED